MTKIHHLNCVRIETPNNGKAIGHCLLLEDENGLALVDTGIGLLETIHPENRLGQKLIDMAGFKFREEQTAKRQIETLGFSPSVVKHCIISHLDPDHIGGLVDFEHAKVHVSAEELKNYESGNQRYLPIQLAHDPEIVTYHMSTAKWYGLEARKVALDFKSDIFLIPLFGHTLGHCGVAINQQEKWVLYVGDAYYLRGELGTNGHPVTQLAISRADSNALRMESLDQIRRLMNDHQHEIEIYCYHDPEEFNSPEINKTRKSVLKPGKKLPGFSA